MKYRHYKGGEYIVLGTARLESTLERMVLYRKIDSVGLWIRPEKEFYGTIQRGIKRFEPIGE